MQHLREKCKLEKQFSYFVQLIQYSLMILSVGGETKFVWVIREGPAGNKSWHIGAIGLIHQQVVMILDPNKCTSFNLLRRVSNGV